MVEKQRERLADDLLLCLFLKFIVTHYFLLLALLENNSVIIISIFFYQYFLTGELVAPEQIWNPLPHKDKRSGLFYSDLLWLRSTLFYRNDTVSTKILEAYDKSVLYYSIVGQYIQDS